MVAVVQLVRASDCGSECRGFESHLPPHKKRKFDKNVPLFCYCTNNHNKEGKTAPKNSVAAFFLIIFQTQIK